MSKAEIVIDVQDWEDEYRAIEPTLTTIEEIIGAARNLNYKPQQLARLLAIAVYRGESAVPPGAKAALNDGYAQWYSQKTAQQKVSRMMPNGKEYSVREFVAAVLEESEQDDGDGHSALDSEVPEPTDNGPVLVRYDDPLAADRAEQYLLRTVPGFFVERMKIIAANDPDRCEAARDAFIEKIEEAYERLFVEREE